MNLTSTNTTTNRTADNTLIFSKADLINISTMCEQCTYKNNGIGNDNTCNQ